MSNYEKIMQLPFSGRDFAQYPKCVGSWRDVNTEAGCLLTAFGAGLGLTLLGTRTKIEWLNRAGKLVVGLEEYKPESWAGNHLYITHDDFMSALDRILEEFGVNVNGASVNVCDIVAAYDQGEPEKALGWVWELIEKWPNKSDIIVKEQIQLPCAIGI